MVLFGILTIVYCLASLAAWCFVVVRMSNGEEPVTYRGEPASRPNVWVFRGFLFLACMMLSYAFTEVPAELPEPSLLIVGTVIQLAVVGMMWCLAVVTTPTPDGLGIRFDSVFLQIRIGLVAAAAALVPTLLVGLLTQNLGEEQQIIQILRETNSPVIWGLMCVSAAILAPVSEELVFRGVLQGYLTTQLRAEPSIALVAMIFAGVHGWPTVVGLMPFALIAGYVFYQTRSIICTISMHAAFNTAMLILLAVELLADA